MSKFSKLDLTELFNNNGFNNDNGYRADFTCKGLFGRYPQEELPDGLNEVYVKETPFKFPNQEIEFNNMELRGQKIHFKSNKYNKIHLLCAADTGSFEEKIKLYCSKNIEIATKSFGVTDWMAPTPYYNDEMAFRFSKSYSIRGIEENFKPSIWYQVIPLSGLESEISSIEFRDNPSVHIFSVTLEIGGNSIANIY